MRIGCHVSISGGIHCAVDNASKIDGTAFQIFTRNPRGWNAKEITDSERDLYKSKLDKSGIDSSATCAHMPYLPNLASPKKDVHEKSIACKTLVEKVSIKVRQSASAKAEQIVAAAKAKAEQESDEISKNGQIKLEEIRARIKSESAIAVEYVVSTVLKPA